jgi:hypothetical protein
MGLPNERNSYQAFNKDALNSLWFIRSRSRSLKMRFWCAIFVSLLFSGVCLAQRPVPTLASPAPVEVSADFLMPVKGSDMSSFGTGGQLAASYFFRENVGIKLQGDYEKTDFDDFRDVAGRVGPIVRFQTKESVQPYLEALVGYARVQATYLSQATSSHGSGSALVGGGFDYHLAGSWYTNLEAGFESDWTVHTRVARASVGISYRFGADRRLR